MRAVIFDMDGVIVNSEPLHEQAFHDVFAKLGYSDNHGMVFADYYGRTDRAFWLDFIARHHPSQTIEELTRLKQDRLLELLWQNKPIFPEIPLLLRRLSTRYKIGLASGSLHPIINKVMEMGDFRSIFKAVVSVQDVTKGKPAPDVFLRASELLGEKPSECWVIEDAAAGVEAALAAKMQVIAITNTLPREKLSRATHVVSSYKEIATLLL